MANTFTKTKTKYGCDIASWLYGIDSMGFDYDASSLPYKTRKARENNFIKRFNGKKENFEIKFCNN